MFKKKIFISGNVYSTLYLNKLYQNSIIWIQKLSNWIEFNRFKYNIEFLLLAKKETIINSDIILYFWPYSKCEAIFHLKYIFSLVPKDSSIFLVGENKSGINTIQNLLNKWILFKKIDSAKHCSLFFGKIHLRPKFKFNTFIFSNIYKNVNIKTIPGVFSYNKIDVGSQLLISTFTNSITGDILDIGCGSGILSILLAKFSNKVKLTLVDTNIAALKSSKLTLKSNNITGNVLLSDVYSNVYKKFDLIISNPPRHKNSKTNLNCIQEIIKNSVQYLKKNGEIRIVVNSHISCHKFFKNTFTYYNVLKKEKNFTIYQAYKKNKIK
ncbi:MAG: 16S rRNA (guanine(1207)-N(2))-methyltransferase RsmC [Buchnera aphidicola (Schlechtendalia peitan)]